MSFALVLKALLEKDSPDLSMLPPDHKANFDKAAVELFEREYYFDAARAFSLLKNRDQLINVGTHCIEKKNLAVAYYAFKEASHKEGLQAVGKEYLLLADLNGALACFDAAEDKEMVAFIKTNF